MDVTEAMRRAIRAHRLLEDEQRLIVAVSGGPDSLVMLHALRELAQRRTLTVSLIVATLDHGLRGPAGASDADFVQDIAKTWGLACVRGTVDARAAAEQEGRSIEDAARTVRYRWLASVAREQMSRIVATAHHADDQAETVLMRLLRGAGTHGLAAMGFSAPLPSDPELRLIRPMLGIRRSQIETYVAEHGLNPRTDASNEDEAFTRNRVRQSLMPMLEREFPGAAEHLISLADSAAADDAYMQEALMALTASTIRQGSELRLARSLYDRAHPALQRRFILWACREIAPPGAEMSFERVMAAVEHLEQAEHASLLQLPGHIVAWRTREDICFRANRS